MRATETFRFLPNNSISLDYQSLSLCYAPIMREDATGLYLYLVSAFDNGCQAHQLSELLNQLQYGLPRLEQGFSVLIVFDLIKLYRDESSYLIKLSSVLPREQFLANPLYRRLLERHIGDLAVADLMVKVPDKAVEVTKTFSEVFSAYGDLAKTCQQHQVVATAFDWSSFQQLMAREGLVFQDEREDMIALHHFADQHGLSWYKTYQLAKETAINGVISLARLRQKQEGLEQSKVSDLSLSHQERLILQEAKEQTREVFLAKIKHLRKATITADERQTLQGMAEMGFLDEVINLMVLYTFNKTNSANLNQRYVLKLANDFAYQGVTTAEMAFERLRQGQSKASRSTASKPTKTNVPKWSNDDYKNETTEEEKRYLEEYKRQALERLSKGET